MRVLVHVCLFACVTKQSIKNVCVHVNVGLFNLLLTSWCGLCLRQGRSGGGKWRSREVLHAESMLGCPEMGLRGTAEDG